LRACLAGGTAAHNTNLLRAEREVIEKGYRDPNGGIHVLAATTTLAAGINTAASAVLAENEFEGARVPGVPPESLVTPAAEGGRKIAEIGKIRSYFYRFIRISELL
jgi:superfamily II RNA helicase